MIEEYIKIEDKKQGVWLIVRINDMSDNEIIARTHSKYHAKDIVLAMRKYFTDEPRDGINE